MKRLRQKKFRPPSPSRLRLIYGATKFISPFPVEAELEETAMEEVQMGDLGYWPPGKAFCIFFGPTPMSTGDRIVPASAVNIIGRVTGDAEAFKKVMHESRVKVTPA